MTDKEIILQQEKEIRSLEKTITRLIKERNEEGKKWDAPSLKEHRALWLRVETTLKENNRMHELWSKMNDTVCEVIIENRRLKKITEHFGHKKTRK